jgi:hypothetical protein
MTIKQDQLDPETTSVTFEDLLRVDPDEIPFRYIHNGSDFIRVDLDDAGVQKLSYYRTNGDRAASFGLENQSTLDVSYESSTGNYYSVRHSTQSDSTIITEEYTLFYGSYGSVTYVDGSYDSFDSSNVVFNPGYATGTGQFHRDVGGKMELGPETGPSRIRARCGPIGGTDLDWARASGVNGSGLFTTTLDYEMPLADAIGMEDALVSLIVSDETNNNERFSVGVMSSGTGDSETLKYSIALSGTEFSTSGIGMHLHSLQLNPKKFLDWSRTTGSGSFTLSIVSSGTGQSSNWEVTSPSGTSYISLSAPYDHSYIFESNNFDGFFSFGMTTPVGTGPITSSGTGETLELSIHLDLQQSATTTGTLSLSRTSGTSPVISNDDTSYSVSFTPLDFLADDTFYVDLYGTTEQAFIPSAILDDYTMTSGAVQESFYRETTTTRTVLRSLSIEEIDDEGNDLSSVISDFDVLGPLVYEKVERSYQTTSGTYDTPVILSSGVISGTESLEQIGLATSNADTGFLLVNDAIHAFNLSQVYGGTTTTGTSGIVTTTGISCSPLSYQFNENSGGFLQYQTTSITDEDVLKTLDITVSSGVTNSDREVFLNLPDSYSEAWRDSVFLHGSDPNTLFYFRANGLSLNTEKVDSTGTVNSGSLTLVDTSASFVTVSNVQKGDIIYISSLESRFTIDTVLDDNTLKLVTAPASSTYSYVINAGAELVQYNIDTELSAFASVNVDDFSLRAGSTDNTTVTAEVINAWGDPLQGKNVSFVVSNGDGAVAPATDSTDVNGQATTVYTAGVTPGPVEITSTVSD